MIAAIKASGMSPAIPRTISARTALTAAIVSARVSVRKSGSTLPSIGLSHLTL
jgi:hypothetical protein